MSLFRREPRRRNQARKAPQQTAYLPLNPGKTLGVSLLLKEEESTVQMVMKLGAGPDDEVLVTEVLAVQVVRGFPPNKDHYATRKGRSARGGTHLGRRRGSPPFEDDVLTIQALIVGKHRPSSCHGGSETVKTRPLADFDHVLPTLPDALTMKLWGAAEPDVERVLAPDDYSTNVIVVDGQEWQWQWQIPHHVRQPRQPGRFF